MVQLSYRFEGLADFQFVSDKFLEINEWRSVLVRLREFEREMYDKDGETSSRLMAEMALPPSTPSPTPSEDEALGRAAAGELELELQGLSPRGR